MSARVDCDCVCVYALGSCVSEGLCVRGWSVAACHHGSVCAHVCGVLVGVSGEVCVCRLCVHPLCICFSVCVSLSRVGVHVPTRLCPACMCVRTVCVTVSVCLTSVCQRSRLCVCVCVRVCARGQFCVSSSGPGLHLPRPVRASALVFLRGRGARRGGEGGLATPTPSVPGSNLI